MEFVGGNRVEPIGNGVVSEGLPPTLVPVDLHMSNNGDAMLNSKSDMSRHVSSSAYSARLNAVGMVSVQSGFFVGATVQDACPINVSLLRSVSIDVGCVDDHK